MRKIALAFLAHPDDAEILCAGTLIQLAAQGWDVHIATATAGDCGTMDETPWQISARRTDEARDAASLIGATYHCLGEQDGMVCFDKPALRKTIDLFRRVAPTLVLTHAPKDYMMDHEMVSLLARSGSFMHGAPNASAFPLVEGTQVPWLYYCDPMEGKDPLGRVVEPTTVIDITEQMDMKENMLASHVSQREWLRAHHGMDEYIDAMKRHGTMRGQQVGTTYAEAFTQHLGHPYPHNDLLAELFGNKKAS